MEDGKGRRGGGGGGAGAGGVAQASLALGGFLTDRGLGTPALEHH